MSIKIKFISLLVFIILLIILILGAAYTRSVTANTLPVTATVMKNRIPQLNEIPTLEDELKNPDLSSQSRLGLEQRLNAFRLMATQVAIPTIPFNPTQFAQPTHGPLGQLLPDGLENTVLCYPGPNRFYRITYICSTWRKATPGRYIWVMAGVDGEDGKQGILLTVDPVTQYEIIEFLTPRKSGPIRITASQGLYLTLKADTGDTFYFDAGALRFIVSLIVPTLAPWTPRPPTPTRPPPTPYLAP